MKTSEADIVFSETILVFEALRTNRYFSGQDSVTDCLSALRDTTEGFFLVCEMLHDDARTSGLQKFDFRHRVMANSILIAMHASLHSSIENFDKKSIIGRYKIDLSASISD